MSSLATAVITGAAGGIGRALVDAFAAAGYRTIGLDKRPGPDSGGIVVADLEELCESDDYRRVVVGELQSNLAGGALQVLINAAAVQRLGGVEEISVAHWRETLNVNLVAPFLLAQALLPELERARGSVLNIASVHSFATKPGFVCYATSKAALVGLTRSMAIDLGPRVRVNAICPAAVDTPMLFESFNRDQSKVDELMKTHPAGRIAQPDEVAQMALYLSSPHAAFATGAAFMLDGGIVGRLHDPE